jgi:uncharacterized membrane protein
MTLYVNYAIRRPGYNLCRSTFAKEVVPMLSSTNFWMCFAGTIYLVAGIIIVRKEVRAAHGWDKLVSLGCVFFAVPLAMFSAEHFGGARFMQTMIPAWIPWHLFWAYFVGFALLAAATSLTVRKFVGTSSTLLGLMFVIFVCTLHIPNVIANPKDRFAWAVVIRDLSFGAGAWALAGLHIRTSLPQSSKWMILFGRMVIGVAATFFALEHFLHPEFAPGVPLPKIMPSWVPLPVVWGYLAGVILLAAGISLLVNKKSRMAAASIGALMTILTFSLYLIILILVRSGSPPEITEGINYVADTLLYGGAALVLASALPRAPDPV